MLIKLEIRYWKSLTQEWSPWDSYKAHHDTDRIAGLLYYGNWDILKLEDKEGSKTQIRRVK